MIIGWLNVPSDWWALSNGRLLLLFGFFLNF